MSVELLSFEQALEKAEVYGKKHLLLGNGFSMACKPDIFAYSSLFVEAKKKMSSELISVFDALETKDFERVIRALNDASRIMSVYYPEEKDIPEALICDADQLKSDLIQAVAGTHPARPYDITDEQCVACRSFLSHFISPRMGGKVYTFNYDLLLYWTLMREGDELDYSHIDLVHDDGFRKDLADADAGYVEWQGEGAASKTQNIHYLHGALHLFDAGHQLQKYTWVNTGDALVDQANSALSRNAFPLFVAEGESHSKMTKIMHNAYLHHNLKSFAGVCGSGARGGTALFVYGHSFDANDAHVLDKIGYGKISHIFVSLYGDPNSPSNTTIRNNVATLAALRVGRGSELNISFYDAESAAIWG